MISIDDIEQIYTTRNNETLYLRGISLHVDKGEIYGIVGRSGAGKSALLRCINSTHKPISGKIRIEDTDITKLNKKDLREFSSKISLVPQNAQLLKSKTVFENVALPLVLNNVAKKDIQEQVSHVISMTGLSEKAHLYPENLTVGQQQRVSIARALVTKPKILLCDEITVGMDHKTTQSIISMLKEINTNLGMTLVIITHDIEIIKSLCSRIAIMHQGKIIEETTPLKLFLAPKTDIAKDFIRATTRMEMPWAYRRRLKLNYYDMSNPLVRMTFSGGVSPELAISNAIDKFNLQIVIIQGYQEQLVNEKINVILAEIQGDTADIDSTCKFLQENGFNIEILGYVSNDT